MTRTGAAERSGAIARETFASRFGAIMTIIGVAIGLGNVWRFPYMVGRFGGAAFVLFYVLIVLVIGVPGLMAELALGRHTRRGPVGAFARAGLPVRQGRRLVLLRHRHRGDGVLHGRDRLGALLRRRRDRARRSARDSTRRRSCRPTRASRRVVAAADGLHGARHAVVRARAAARPAARHRAREHASSSRRCVVMLRRAHRARAHAAWRDGRASSGTSSSSRRPT